MHNYNSFSKLLLVYYKPFHQYMHYHLNKLKIKNKKPLQFIPPKPGSHIHWSPVDFPWLFANGSTPPRIKRCCCGTLVELHAKELTLFTWY